MKIKKFITSLLLLCVAFVFCGAIVIFNNSNYIVNAEQESQLEYAESEICNFNNNQEIDFADYNVNTASGKYSSYNSAYPTGTVNNNLFYIVFNGEEDLINQAEYFDGKTTVQALNDKYNTNLYSPKNYYHYNSNGTLSLDTLIYVNKSNASKVYTAQLSQNRNYFMPYMCYNNKTYNWERNPEGYFQYSLIYSDTYIENARDYDDLSTSTLIANVYDDGTVGDAKSNCKSDCSVTDTDISDKIISYSYARQLVNSHSNYYLVESVQRNYRELRLQNEVNKLYKTYFNTSVDQDYDDNGVIDSCAYIFMDGGDYDVEWAELLWAHQWNLNWFKGYAYNGCPSDSAFLANYGTFLRNVGYTEEESNVITQYLFESVDIDLSNGESLNFGTFLLMQEAGFMEDLTNEWKYMSYTKDNSTICHELGHVLGLPDLYNGSGDTSMIGNYSQMSRGHNFSYMTSHERLDRGWLNEGTNVVELTENGTYTLNAVSGLDGTKTVAFYIQGTGDYSYQRFYFEYRSNDSGINPLFDQSSGQPGLLIYRINDSSYTKRTNNDDTPYWLYGMRNGNDSNYLSFQEGETFGNNTGTNTIDDIAFYDHATNSYVNAQITISVTNIDGNLLTFTVSCPNLATATTEISSSAIDDNNLLLIQRLKNIAGVTTLTNKSLKNVTTMDLRDCSIKSLDFLSLFQLNSLVYLNLSNNYLDESDIFGIYTNNGPLLNQLSKILLYGNIIDLVQFGSNISLINMFYPNKVEIGLQFPKDMKPVNDYKYVNKDITLYYFSSSYDCVTTYIQYKNSIGMIDYITQQTISRMQSGLNSVTISGPRLYNIKFTYNAGNAFGISENKNYCIDMITLTTPYNSVEDELEIWQDESFPSLDELVELTNYNSGTITTYDYEVDPSTVNSGHKTANINIYCGSKLKDTVVLYYYVRSNEAPIVEINGGSPLEISRLSVTAYEDLGITVKEWGEVVSYTYKDGFEDGDTNVYDYSIYTTTYENEVYIKKSLVLDMDFSIVGVYIVEYSLIDTFDREFNGIAQRIVSITNLILDSSSFDSNVYARLLEISGKTTIKENDFELLDYIDLSSINASSIKGIDKLRLKQDVVINFSDNILSSTTEISNLLTLKSQISKLLFIKNLYPSENIDLVLTSSQQNKCVFALQSLPVSFTKSDNSSIEMLFRKDYSEDFTIALTSGATETLTGCQTSGYGSFEITFTVKNHIENSYTFRTNIVRILNNQIAPFIKEYSENLNLNISDLFIVNGAPITSFRITSNVNSIDLTTVGQKTITYSFAYTTSPTNVVVSHDILVNVVDTVKPIIVFGGVKDVYCGSVAEYISNFRNDTCTATDAYDGALDVEIIEPSNMTTYGIYEVEYKAEDSSGNMETCTRTVNIGTVAMNENLINTNLTTKIILNFNFVTFDNSQFDITYKLNDQASRNYLSTGFLLTDLGLTTISVKLVHKANTSLIYEFSKNAQVDDVDAPSIAILGEVEVYLYVGQTYVESGYSITDNSTREIATDKHATDEIKVTEKYELVKGDNKQTVSTITTDTAKTYLITYTATDNTGNTSFKTRNVTVQYYPIDNVKIVESNLLPKYETGKIVNFSVEVESEYQTAPNPTINWYVDGELYQTTTEKTIAIELDDIGEHKVYATLETENNGELVTYSSQEIVINIYGQSSYEKIAIYAAIIIGSIALLGIAIYFIKKAKNRNFY